MWPPLRTARKIRASPTAHVRNAWRSRGGAIRSFGPHVSTCRTFPEHPSGAERHRPRGRGLATPITEALELGGISTFGMRTSSTSSMEARARNFPSGRGLEAARVAGVRVPYTMRTHRPELESALGGTHTYPLLSTPSLRQFRIARQRDLALFSQVVPSIRGRPERARMGAIRREHTLARKPPNINRGRGTGFWGRPPSLRTGRAVFPHPALQSVGSFPRLAR